MILLQRHNELQYQINCKHKSHRLTVTTFRLQVASCHLPAGQMAACQLPVGQLLNASCHIICQLARRRLSAAKCQLPVPTCQLASCQLARCQLVRCLPDIDCQLPACQFPLASLPAASVPDASSSDVCQIPLASCQLASCQIQLARCLLPDAGSHKSYSCSSSC